MASPSSPQPEYPVPAEAEFLKALKSLNLVSPMYDQVDIKLWNVPATINSPPIRGSLTAFLIDFEGHEEDDDQDLLNEFYGDNDKDFDVPSLSIAWRRS
jgi:hypothetical protein